MAKNKTPEEVQDEETVVRVEKFGPVTQTDGFGSYNN